MQSFRAAAVTLNAILGDVRGNLDKIARWTAAAAAQGANFVLFPELCVNGHCDPDTHRHAEPIPGGPSTAALHALASLHNLILCAGLSERDGDAVYNTQILIGPQGLIGKQRKIHLSRDEVLYFQPGNAIEVFDLGFARAGISICYDAWSPEVCRILAIQGAEVLLLPHASRMKIWDDTPASERAAAEFISGYFRRIFPARAIENAAYVIAVNQAGRAGTVSLYPPGHPNQPHHAGGCFFFDPAGETLAALPADAIREDMLLATLDAAPLHAARSHPNYTIRTRRPALYSELIR
ncbi:MAG: hypothetical protein JNK48_14820 [Bryobacterales bacterium]|nr:hypothetical protein [Bryobacterales bacterium]